MMHLKIYSNFLITAQIFIHYNRLIIVVYYPVDWEKTVKKECKRRRYSDRTAQTYIYCINKFLDYCKKDLGKISKKDVREFLEKMSDKGLSGNSMNTYHMAIRFLFEQVLDKRMWIDIKYSKVPKKLPIVLSKSEVKTLIENIKNHKHKIMISLMYSAGLRVSELLNLKVEDFNFKESFGFVRQGKGMKDRLFIIADKLKIVLLQMCVGKKKEDLVFASNRGQKYSSRTIQEIIKKTAKLAGINKKIHPHTLRHSFATHLIENGYSVSEVQALLGHKSPETTMIYLHTSSSRMLNIKSPLDSL